MPQEGYSQATAPSSSQKTSTGSPSSSTNQTGRARNKLGYHRTAVACSHCRKRKIRCMTNAERVRADQDPRCDNCYRLKRPCTFHPVDQASSAERRRNSSVDAHSPTSATMPPVVIPQPTMGTDFSMPSPHTQTLPASVDPAAMALGFNNTLPTTTGVASAWPIDAFQDPQRLPRVCPVNTWPGVLPQSYTSQSSPGLSQRGNSYDSVTDHHYVMDPQQTHITPVTTSQIPWTTEMNTFMAGTGPTLQDLNPTMFAQDGSTIMWPEAYSVVNTDGTFFDQTSSFTAEGYPPFNM